MEGLTFGISLPAKAEASSEGPAKFLTSNSGDWSYHSGYPTSVMQATGTEMPFSSLTTLPSVLK